ncbi:PARCEL domain protein [Mycoplasma leachii PG50]|uniref:PARCEL domain protein n=1 Tax=Mycoplasma leachii (strain DSM 21131 / NCTC 10133 / N29 / PG50) TaxID=880447 RepID=E4PTF3_MYCLG|nr:PARCEL domain protein [Mycoplasma leachii PG50]
MKKLMVILASFFMFILLITFLSFSIFSGGVKKLLFNRIKKEEYKVHKYKDNKTRTEITDLGFYKNGSTITLMQIPWHITKVSSTLPKEVKSLRNAFANRFEHHKEVTGFETWDTSEIIDMSYTFYNNETINADLSSWKTNKVTNMQGMFKNAIKFNNNGKPLKWDTSKVTSMNSMFDGAKKFNQNLRSWVVDEIKDNKNFSRGSGFSHEPNKRPLWKQPEINDPIIKKPETRVPEVIIHPSPPKPKVNIPLTRIITPTTKWSPILKPTPDSKKGLEIPKANLSTTNQQSKKLSTSAIVGIVVGSQVVLTSLAVGTPYLIKRFKK